MAVSRKPVRSFPDSVDKAIADEHPEWTTATPVEKIPVVVEQVIGEITVGGHGKQTVTEQAMQMIARHIDETATVEHGRSLTFRFAYSPYTTYEVVVTEVHDGDRGRDEA